jgi:hypothetical protein
MPQLSTVRASRDNAAATTRGTNSCSKGSIPSASILRSSPVTCMRAISVLSAEPDRMATNSAVPNGRISSTSTRNTSSSAYGASP